MSRLRQDLNPLRDVSEWLPLARRARFKASLAARLCDLSKRQLQRYCQQRFGRPLQDWLDEQRIVAAGYLLQEKKSVKNVAFELGFKQASHFSRQFKRHYGITPSEFLDRFAVVKTPDKSSPRRPG